MSSTICPIEFRIEDSADAEQPYMWAVYTAGGSKRLAYSETYVAREGPNNAVGAVKRGHTTYQVFEGTDGYWYFHIQGLNNRILGRSAYRYHTDAACRADQELVADNAADAPYYDHVPAT